jgi:hypothetical protein
MQTGLGHQQQEGVGSVSVILKAGTILSKEALACKLFKN